MKIGDLVRANGIWNNAIGIIVDERVLENAKGFDRMYKVLWQDGNSFLAERKCLKAIKGGNNGNAK